MIEIGPLTLATKVAAEMGEDWTPVAYMSHGAKIRHKDGRELFVRVGGYQLKDRAEISGSYPQTERYGTEHVSITVRADRDPAAIAREIGRRLLPRYTEEWLAVLEYNRKAADDALMRTVAENELMSILPRLNRRTGRDELTWSPSGSGYGSVRLHYDGNGGSVELRSLSAAQVRAVVAALAQCTD